MTPRPGGFNARLIAALAALLVGGCVNLFKPATPQPPDKSTTVSVNYSSAEATLTTLSAAIKARGLANGRTAYASAFADKVADGVGFTTSFDAGVALEYVARWGELPVWTLDREKDFYTAFVNQPRSGSFALRWSVYEAHGNDELDTVEGTALLHRTYEVFAKDASGSIADTLATGIADLSFRRFGSRWAIIEWDDLAIGATASGPDRLSFSYWRLNPP